jgi:uncharacterized protein
MRDDPFGSVMFSAAVPPALQALERANALLQRPDVGPNELAARLAPDMFDCASQLRTVAIFALRATWPLTNRDPEQKQFEASPYGLRARIGHAQGQIGLLTKADFEGSETRQITHRAGFADLTQTGADYLHLFALPNLWFHLSMAYATLRASGVPLGKADYDGLHSYPPGFSF